MIQLIQKGGMFCMQFQAQQKVQDKAQSVAFQRGRKKIKDRLLKLMMKQNAFRQNLANKYNGKNVSKDQEVGDIDENRTSNVYQKSFKTKIDKEKNVSLSASNQHNKKANKYEKYISTLKTTKTMENFKHKQSRELPHSKTSNYTVKKATYLNNSNQASIDDTILKAYQAYMKANRDAKSAFSKTENPIRRRKSSKIKNATLPYGFRTGDMYKDLFEKINNEMKYAQEDSNRSRTLYTNRMVKEYYSNDGFVPSNKIFDTLFRPALQEKSTNKKMQAEVTQRLLKHTDKVREKNKIREINLEMEGTATIQASQKEGTMAVPLSAKLPELEAGDDYKMYEQQMKLEIIRKAKMYDMVVEEMKKEREHLKQAKPCKGSERIVSKKTRKGSVHDRLYDQGKRKMSRDVREDVESYSKDEYPFRPILNKMAKDLVRPGRIEDRLLDDAKKRIQTLNNKDFERMKTIKKESNPKQGSKSGDLVFKRFSKEYEDALFELGKDKGDSFNYNNLCKF